MGNSEYTIFLLRPSDFTSKSRADNIIRIANDFDNNSLQVNMVKFILEPLQSSLRGWQSLQEHIGNLLGNGNEIFEKEVHDEMIYDDGLFSRSRKYLWIINCV